MTANRARGSARLDARTFCYHQARTLNNLGETHHAVGNLTAARAAWRQVAATLGDPHHPDAERVAAKLDERGA